MLKKIVVLVSGGGTNLQALLDAKARGEIPSGEISCVVSSRAGARALERAADSDVATRVLARAEYPTRDSYDTALLALLRELDADLIVLAGFMYVLGAAVVSEYENRIINVHPSLIPSFCGDGFYGLRVHEAALSYGVKVTGATVHFVNEITDGGKIILQRAVDIEDSDTPETLQKRVMEQAEWVILPRAVELICKKLIEDEKGE